MRAESAGRTSSLSYSLFVRLEDLTAVFAAVGALIVSHEIRVFRASQFEVNAIACSMAMSREPDASITDRSGQPVVQEGQGPRSQAALCWRVVMANPHGLVVDAGYGRTSRRTCLW